MSESIVDTFEVIHIEVYERKTFFLSSLHLIEVKIELLIEISSIVQLSERVADQGLVELLLVAHHLAHIVKKCDRFEKLAICACQSGCIECDRSDTSIFSGQIKPITPVFCALNIFCPLSDSLLSFLIKEEVYLLSDQLIFRISGKPTETLVYFLNAKIFVNSPESF